MVRLETDFARKWGFDLALVAAGSGEESAAELGFDEELAVEDSGGGVEGSAGDGRVDVVRAGDGVRGEQVDDFGGREPAAVGHALEDARHAVLRLGDGPVVRGERRIGAAGDEGEAGRTGAVRHADGASELDAVGRLGGGEATRE